MNEQTNSSKQQQQQQQQQQICLELQKTINELSENYKQEVTTLDDKSKSKILKQIKQNFSSIKKYSDDKVELAYSTYELVSLQMQIKCCLHSVCVNRLINTSDIWTAI